MTVTPRCTRCSTVRAKDGEWAYQVPSECKLTCSMG